MQFAITITIQITSAVILVRLVLNFCVYRHGSVLS